jgi:hypothetical protein
MDPVCAGGKQEAGRGGKSNEVFSFFAENSPVFL